METSPTLAVPEQLAGMAGMEVLAGPVVAVGVRRAVPVAVAPLDKATLAEDQTPITAAAVAEQGAAAGFHLAVLAGQSTSLALL